MSSQAIVLILLSAAIHVSWNALNKSSANPRVFAFIKGSLLSLLALVLLPFVPLGALSSTVWVCLVISGIVHFIYILALSSAYQTGDISFVYPIARSAPALVPVVAYFLLDEILSPRGIVGIAIVVLCIFLLQFRGEAATRLLRLSHSIRQPDFRWAILTLLSVVTYTIVDKAGMVAFSKISEIPTAHRGPIYFGIETVISYILYSLFLLRQNNVGIGKIWTTEWKKILPAAAGSMISYSLILHVMQTEIVSYIVTLRQSSVLMAVLVGGIVFGEGLGYKRLAIALAMLVGFYLVTTP